MVTILENSKEYSYCIEYCDIISIKTDNNEIIKKLPIDGSLFTLLIYDCFDSNSVGNKTSIKLCRIFKECFYSNSIHGLLEFKYSSYTLLLEGQFEDLRNYKIENYLQTEE